MLQCVLVRIELEGISPPIWRSFAVPTAITMHQFHEAIQTVMGWDNTHLYQFRLGDDVCQLPDEDSPARATNSLKEVLNEWLLDGMTRLKYLYDFGDGWEQELVFGELKQDMSMACIDGGRACPPEDCGGALGYSDLIDALADPGHSRHRELKRWAGKWKPKEFDLGKVNARLKKLKLV